MLKKKYKQFNNSSYKSSLDQILWFIENYLPQKKDRGVQKNLYMDNLEAETFNKFSKLASLIFKTESPFTKNTTIFFNFYKTNVSINLFFKLSIIKKNIILMLLLLI